MHKTIWRKGNTEKNSSFGVNSRVTLKKSMDDHSNVLLYSSQQRCTTENIINRKHSLPHRKSQNKIKWPVQKFSVEHILFSNHTIATHLKNRAAFTRDVSLRKHFPKKSNLLLNGMKHSVKNKMQREKNFRASVVRYTVGIIRLLH